MKRTRQRFLLAIGALGASLSTLVLVISLPVIADAGLEGAHTLLRACDHAFRPHYLAPATFLAALLLGVVLMVVGRFVAGVRATVQLTRAATAPLMAVGLPAVPVRVARVVRTCGVRGSVEVVEAPSPLAFCHGIRSPRICISTGLAALLDDAELGAVLLHEDYHRQRREPLRLALLAGLGHVLRCWPGLSPLLAEARTETEVAADASAIARSGSARPLARALLKILEHPTGPSPAPGLGFAIAPLSATEARIDCLTRAVSEPYPPLPWAYFGGLAGALAGPSLALVTLASVTNLHPLFHPCHGM